MRLSCRLTSVIRDNPLYNAAGMVVNLLPLKSSVRNLSMPLNKPAGNDSSNVSFRYRRWMQLVALKPESHCDGLPHAPPLKALASIEVSGLPDNHNVPPDQLDAAHVTPLNTPACKREIRLLLRLIEVSPEYPEKTPVGNSLILLS